MTTGLHRRYAVYFCPSPDSTWARASAQWLGWDVNTACALESVGQAWVSTPQKYGFHATLKAPFRPNAPDALAGLLDSLQQLAGRHQPIELAPQLNQIGSFWAFTQGQPCPELNALEADLVRSLEPYRAPLNPAEMAKRLQADLSPHQRALLDRWGYPYVLDQFQFHLTLTGSDPAGAAGELIHQHFAQAMASPLWVRDLALVGERQDGFFEVIHRQPLG